jgi:hypothetical protein
MSSALPNVATTLRGPILDEDVEAYVTLDPRAIILGVSDDGGLRAVMRERGATVSRDASVRPPGREALPSSRSVPSRRAGS